MLIKQSRFIVGKDWTKSDTGEAVECLIKYWAIVLSSIGWNTERASFWYPLELLHVQFNRILRFKTLSGPNTISVLLYNNVFHNVFSNGTKTLGSSELYGIKKSKK